MPVLMYHSISAGAAAPRYRRFALSPGEFAAQLDYLAAARYHAMTAAELARCWARGRQAPARAVVLTFDDALTDFAAVALPVLRRHGFRATLFVPTGYVGATARWLAGCGEDGRRVLSWQELRDLAGAGMEIAAHSHSHPQLDRVPGAVIEDEVRRCKDLLEDQLGAPAEGFAYPFGYWNRAARGAVAAAGFRYACAVAELAAWPGDDLWTLPRLTVNAGQGVPGLARLLGLRSSPAQRRAAAGKRLAWRAARQGVRAVGGDPRAGWAELEPERRADPARRP